MISHTSTNISVITQGPMTSQKGQWRHKVSEWRDGAGMMMPNGWRDGAGMIMPNGSRDSADMIMSNGWRDSAGMIMPSGWRDGAVMIMPIGWRGHDNAKWMARALTLIGGKKIVIG